jgi:Ser/Thr protein kinase RdoA (MazF antagonist)
MSEPGHAGDDDPGDRAGGQTPGDFASLTPEAILDAMAELELPCDGRMLALNSYENRVYLLYGEDAPDQVVKFYRPGRWSDAQILEEHAFAEALVEAEVPMVAPRRIGGRTLHSIGGMRLAVYPRAGGRAPELDDPDVREWLGRYLGRIHMVGAGAPFVQRPALDIATFGQEPYETIVHGDWLPPALRESWQAAARQCLEAVEASFARAGDVSRIRVHGDVHLGNVLWTDAGPHFVDLDDARTAPAVQDLWMLLSGDRADMTVQLSDVLEGYETFREFDRRELQLVEALRTLRLIHYSAWIARRWHDPAFPAAFPWFGTERYWQDRILELREQIAAMSEPALVV